MFVYAIRRPDESEIYIPYPGGCRTGSLEAAQRLVSANKHLGWKVVRCELVVLEEME